MIYTVDGIYIERYTDEPYLLLRIDEKGRSAIEFKFVQEKGVGVQTHLALETECGEIRRDSYGDIYSVDVQHGMFSDKFVLKQTDRFCKHAWKQTEGFSSIYLDCLKCGAKQ